MGKVLIDIFFTQENCKKCKEGIWGKIDCNESISDNAEVLNEEHEHYVCLAKCETPGYKTEIYKL